ncbi:MAG: YIP1 family protein [Oscillospiraceae bacterium]|jgi:hypothetical protein|nr:YIP1 family protein [Oscillospiraceae bacterium]
MQKIKKILCFTALFFVILMMPATAGSNGKSYTYNAAKEAVSVPNPYNVREVLGAGLSLSEPSDIQADGEHIYVLDSGNARVVVLNKAYAYEREIVFSKDGNSYKTNELTGLWVDGQTLLVVDHGAECIFRADMRGQVTQIYTAPENDVSQTQKNFLPHRVVTDGTGYLYILLENEYRGLMVMTPDGDFVTYYGSVQVETSAALLMDMFWRRFMTDEQIAATSKYIPGGYNSVTTDGSGFIYTVRGISSRKNEMVCKLNPGGKNVLANTGVFGDYEAVQNVFTDIAVDESGFISVIDSIGKRIFQYSPDGDLLYAFGGEGEQEGLFQTPVSLIYNGVDLLVLDKQTGCLTILERTDFAAEVQEAVLLYRKALFDEAGVLWKRVLAQNSNYELAHVGLGKIAEAKKDYKSAMSLYRMGGSKIGYSSAFYKYRTQALRKNFSVIAAAAVLMVLLGALFLRLRKKKRTSPKSDWEHGGKLKYIGFTLFHPFDGFGELRYNRQYSLTYAGVLAVIWFFIACLNYNYNGYIFNSEYPEDFNMLIVFGSTVGVIVLFALCNWLLSTFFEGKGTLKQITVSLCYCLLPIIAGAVLELIGTNVLSANEGFFITVVRSISVGWSLFLMFVAMGQINQYGFKRNAASIFCSILGMLVIVFLVILFFNLWTQLSNFCMVIFREISYRILAAG